MSAILKIAKTLGSRLSNVNRDCNEDRRGELWDLLEGEREVKDFGKVF